MSCKSTPMNRNSSYTFFQPFKLFSNTHSLWLSQDAVEIRFTISAISYNLLHTSELPKRIFPDINPWVLNVDQVGVEDYVGMVMICRSSSPLRVNFPYTSIFSSIGYSREKKTWRLFLKNPPVSF
jgi:hypothetical protein